jgi:mannosyl-oligosaccharide alpha-1,2-mannosidase
MHFQSLIIPFLGLLSSRVLALPHAPGLMTKQSRDDSALSSERADAVKAAFEFAWAGYYEYAFPHDELHPVSNGYSDSR